MEQHPIPQNVTTFQFRLIGDMTIKQFGYLAGGAILAYICYKLPLPLFLNWPLAIVSAVGGFGFAFVPIEERPMDVWVLSFFKSVYSPTQYTWSRREQAPPAPAAPAPQATDQPFPAQLGEIQPPVAAHAAPAPPTGRREDILSTLFTPTSQGAGVLTQTMKTSAKPFDFLDRLFDMLMPKPHKGSPPTAQVHQVAFPSAIPAKMDFTPPPTVRTRDDKATGTTHRAPEGDKPTGVKVEPAGTTPDQSHAEELRAQLSALREKHDKMEAEVLRLRLQTSPPSPPKPTETYVATPASRSGPSVRIITPDRAVKAGLPRLTTFPNVVTGIVKDGDQNLLPGVLVTVKDKDGVPVRALKTNRLGQFAASTPLSSATYFVEIEDPRLRYTFDRAQITLNGSIVPALEIFAKSQKEITRAKLEKELFGDRAS